MEYLYEFTSSEHRVILAAHARFLQVLQVVAEIHDIEGPFNLAPDMKGFVQPANPVFVPPAPPK